MKSYQQTDQPVNVLLLVYFLNVPPVPVWLRLLSHGLPRGRVYQHQAGGAGDVHGQEYQGAVHHIKRAVWKQCLIYIWNIFLPTHLS